MSYNVNPMLLVQAIKNGQNPQQLMLNILQNNKIYLNIHTIDFAVLRG